jgi:hypothetical protein
MTVQFLVDHLVAFSLPALLVVEEFRGRRRPLPPVPSRSPVRNPSDERIGHREPIAKAR